MTKNELVEFADVSSIHFNVNLLIAGPVDIALPLHSLKKNIRLIADSTCSRASCSICFDSVSDKDSESYSGESESEDSPKRTKSKFHPPAKHFSRSSSSQIPPLPVLHPSTMQNSGLMSTSFNDVSLKKSDNLMSTAFNVPNNGIADSTVNTPLSIPKVYATNFAKRSPYKISGIPSLGTNSQSYNNLSDDLLSSSLGNLRLLGLNPRERSFAKSTGNVSQNQRGDNSINDLMTGMMSDDCLISTRFNAPCELTAPDISTTSSSSLLANIENTIMSTSFSNLPLSSICESGATSVFRNGNTSGQNQSDIPHIAFCNSVPTDKITTSYNTTINKENSLSFFNSGNNLMSTSFNDPGDDNLESVESTVNADIPPAFDTANSSSESTGKVSPLEFLPPPPMMTSSLANYLNNLPKKNIPRSSGLTDINDPSLKFPMPRPNSHLQILQRQSSVSNISQSQHRSNNFQPIRNYRLNYDLDYVPFYGSSENLDYQAGPNYGDSGTLSSSSHFQSHYNSQHKLVESKHSRLSISQSNSSIKEHGTKESKMSMNVPPLPVLNTSNSKTTHQCQGSVDSLTSNEKPKVKFSNTVTHILVPGTVSVQCCYALLKPKFLDFFRFSR